MTDCDKQVSSISFDECQMNERKLVSIITIKWYDGMKVKTIQRIQSTLKSLLSQKPIPRNVFDWYMDNFACQLGNYYDVKDVTIQRENCDLIIQLLKQHDLTLEQCSCEFVSELIIDYLLDNQKPFYLPTYFVRDIYKCMTSRILLYPQLSNLTIEFLSYAFTHVIPIQLKIQFLDRYEFTYQLLYDLLSHRRVFEYMFNYESSELREQLECKIVKHIDHNHKFDALLLIGSIDRIKSCNSLKLFTYKTMSIINKQIHNTINNKQYPYDNLKQIKYNNLKYAMEFYYELYNNKRIDVLFHQEHIVGVSCIELFEKMVNAIDLEVQLKKEYKSIIELLKS